MKSQLKKIIVLLICSISSSSFGQNPRPLLHELARCNVETVLLWESVEIDDHPIWSPDSKQIAINDRGHWRKLNIEEVFLTTADWLDHVIGQNISEVSETVSDLEVKQFTDTTIYGPRKVTTTNNGTIELRNSGFQTEFWVNNKKLWETGGDNCHSLALSPDENYVAFISEMNGLMVFCLTKKTLVKTLPNHVIQNGMAINKLAIGETDKAEKIWDKLILSNKEYSEPLFWKAYIQMSQNNQTKAISYLDQAIAVDSTVSNYYFIRAGIFQKLGKMDQAIENYQSYIKLRPTDLYGYYYLAELYQSIDDPSNACNYFKLAKKYHSVRAQKFIDELCENE